MGKDVRHVFPSVRVDAFSNHGICLDTGFRPGHGGNADPRVPEILLPHLERQPSRRFRRGFRTCTFPPAAMMWNGASRKSDSDDTGQQYRP